MLGKVLPAHHIPAVEGITPAYAGKSRLQGLNLQPNGDHPRVCGENQ